MEKEKIAWQTKEYEYREKTNDWYWAVGIIAASAVVVSVIYGNYIFAIFMILATATLIMYSLKKPEMFEVEINSKGIKIQKELHLYKNIKSFWIEELGPEKKLVLSIDRILMPTVALSLEDASVEDVRALLAKHIKESEIHEPVGQKIMEYLGF